MPELAAHGLTVRLPAGWEGEIYVRDESPTPTPPGGLEGPAGGTSLEEVRRPVLHAANFSLPPERGDYGGGAVELMGSRHLFVSLLEHGPESVGTALFRSEGIPTLDADEFHPQQMQRALPGQSGRQLFFQQQGRAFCLYVVLGSHNLRGLLVQGANDLLGDLVIE